MRPMPTTSVATMPSVSPMPPTELSPSGPPNAQTAPMRITTQPIAGQRILGCTLSLPFAQDAVRDGST